MHHAEIKKILHLKDQASADLTKRKKLQSRKLEEFENVKFTK